MSTFLLDLETFGGADVRECARVAVHVANTLGLTVRFRHNDVEVFVNRGDDALAVYSRWFDQFERNAGRRP